VAAGLGIAVIGNAQPTITQQPTNQSVSLGAAAFFRVTAKSAGPIAYQWCHQGTPLLWATNAGLALTNIQVTDAGPYTVALTDATGITNSKPAMLEVNPTFTKIASGDIVTNKGHWHGAARRRKISLTLKVGGADRDRTCDPHNAIVLPPLNYQLLMTAFRNIDRFIDSFFSCLHPIAVEARNSTKIPLRLKSSTCLTRRNDNVYPMR